MKKLLSCFLVCLILFNFIFCGFGYARPNPDGLEGTTNPYLNTGEESSNSVHDLVYSGTAPLVQDSATTQTMNFANFGASIVGFITGIIARLLNVFIALQIDLIIGDLTYSSDSQSSTPFFWFTIDRTVFNRVPLFNINFFNTEDTYTVGDVTVTANKSNLEIKKGISGVYYLCRIISLALGLLVLIYIGIRMAVSTVASDQAKYKKMLISWVESILIIFLMPYIMIFIINIGELITNSFYTIRVNLMQKNSQDQPFEYTVRNLALNCMFNTSGLTLTFYSILYWLLLFTEVKFFWAYTKRLLMVGFLIMISPLITITYSIDKAGDGKAQAFSTWMKEFILNVLIQPLHAIIYLVFLITANNICERAPLVAIALLFSMSEAERMVKTIFDVKDGASIKGMDKMFKKGK